jgi:hypothetical protein
MRMEKRSVKFVKGLKVWWEDKTPLDETTKPEKGGVGHKNFALRPVANDIWRTVKHWAAEKKPLLWLIKITVVFRYPNGYEQGETREIKGRGTIDDLSDICIDEIKDAMRCGNMQHYVTTKFDIECLGQ